MTLHKFPKKEILFSVKIGKLVAQLLHKFPKKEIFYSYQIDELSYTNFQKRIFFYADRLILAGIKDFNEFDIIEICGSKIEILLAG